MNQLVQDVQYMQSTISSLQQKLTCVEQTRNKEIRMLQTKVTDHTSKLNSQDVSFRSNMTDLQFKLNNQRKAIQQLENQGKAYYYCKYALF